MSLLLKALKQAEAANATKPGADKPAADGHASGQRFESDLDHLETLAAPGDAQGREWVEPPGQLFGSSGLTPESRNTPAFRWPQLSLVSLTALLATLIALGYGTYLYFALQPPAAVASIPVNATPSAAPAATAIQTVAVDPAPTAVPAAPLPQPDTFAAAPAVAPPPPLPARTISRAASPASDTAALPAALPQFQPDTRTTLLNQAYAAYREGALAEAQRLYTQAAGRGNNVDALLGLAAIASVQNRDADAQRLYREVLDLDPRNAAAQGALLDLLGNTDSQATESRLKTLIERDPGPQLYQTLGNLYADQGRWHDAQAAYFEAWRGAPDNADYAFNLAVSLDQLRQYPAALTYYEKALAGGGVHRFDRAQAEARIRQLKPAL